MIIVTHEIGFAKEVADQARIYGRRRHRRTRGPKVVLEHQKKNEHANS